MNGELAEGFEQLRNGIPCTFCKRDSGYVVEDKQTTLKKPLQSSQGTFRLFWVSECHEYNPYFQVPSKVALKMAIY